MFNRAIRSKALAVVAALVVTAALSACSPKSGPTGTTVSPAATTPTPVATLPTPRATSTPSATSTPEPAAAPLDAQSAWNACVQVAQDQYVVHDEGATIRPFSSTTTLNIDGDGATTVYVFIEPSRPVEGAGSIAFICFMSGTAAAPHVDGWTWKDV